MKEKDKVQNSIVEATEWQEHQYDPGGYWAGKVPPFMLRKNKPLGIGLMIVGVMWLIGTAINFLDRNYLSVILSFIFTILFFYASYQNIRK